MMMTALRSFALVAGIAAAACARSEEATEREQRAAPPPATDTSGAQAVQAVEPGDTAPAGAMPGMDHAAMAGMPGMDRGAGKAQSSAQHAEHAPPPPAGRGAAQPHAGMPGMDHPRTQALVQPEAGRARAAGRPAAAADAPHQGMRGMDHAGTPSGGAAERPAAVAAQFDAEATEQLRTLVAELLRDPIVQERVRADSALRRRWENEAVRRRLLPPSH